MATCTLDDLVPSLKCNRITLEPVTGMGTGTNNVNFGEYQVVLDISIRDTIEEEGGIAGYMLTDTFRDNVTINILYSRDHGFKQLYDYLTTKEISTYRANGSPTTRGITPAQKSKIFGMMSELVSDIHLTPLNSMFVDRREIVLDILNQYTNSELVNISFPDAFLPTGHHGSLGVVCELLQLSIVQQMDQMPWDPSVWLPSEAFIGRLIRFAITLVYSDVEFDSFTMADALSYDMSRVADPSTNNYTTGFGDIKTDEDGRLVYDIKIPDTAGCGMTHTNSVDVENCYVFMHAYYDLEKALAGKGLNIAVPMDYETINFFYNSVHVCRILENKLPASNIVQDFRISERIQEIMNLSTMSAYDQTIDNIALKSSEFNPDNSSLTSELYSSYVFEYGVDDPSIFTRNYFYLNLIKLLKRKSNLSFLYNNVTIAYSNSTNQLWDPRSILSMATILKMQIYRVRVDEYEVPTLIKEYNDIIKVGELLNDAQMYKFVDTDFVNVTDGEYTYELHMDIKDPMYEELRIMADGAKLAISKLKAAIEYIHNNPQHYNELRDELSSTAKSFLWGNYFGDPDFSTGIACAEALMAILTGFTFSQVNLLNATRTLYTTPTFNVIDLVSYINSGYTAQFPEIDATNYFTNSDFSDPDRFNRRRIENFYRILQDLLFGASKFIAIPGVVSSADENNIVNKKTNRTVSYKRTWDNTTVKADLDPRMMIGVQRRQRDSITMSEMTTEYNEEVSKHVSQGASISAGMFGYMNFMTPRYIAGDLVAYNSFNAAIPNNTYINIIDASVKKPDAFIGEMITGLYVYGLGEYNGTLDNLRNDSGVFESLMHDHAVTVRNKTADAIDSTLHLPRPSENVFGLDSGDNADRDKFGYTEEEAEAAREELETQKEEIIQSLFDEKVKKESLIMDCMIDKKAHHLLDRREFVQGDREGIRYRGYLGYDYHLTVQKIDPSTGAPRLAHPRLWDPLLLPYWRLANESVHDTHALKIMGSRFVADNTHLVYYLAGFDEDMNPEWRELLQSEISIGAVRDRTLCKLVRFQMRGDRMSIGQGSTSELEITNRYFYLKM